MVFQSGCINLHSLQQFISSCCSQPLFLPNVFSKGFQFRSLRYLDPIPGEAEGSPWWQLLGQTLVLLMLLVVPRGQQALELHFLTSIRPFLRTDSERKLPGQSGRTQLWREQGQEKAELADSGNWASI